MYTCIYTYTKTQKNKDTHKRTHSHNTYARNTLTHKKAKTFNVSFSQISILKLGVAKQF